MTDSAVQTDSRSQREAMVAQQIAARGVRDPLVLRAMRKVPREAFLAEERREFAYEDSPLSQPYIVAYMPRVLDEFTLSYKSPNGKGVIVFHKRILIAAERFGTQDRPFSQSRPTLPRRSPSPSPRCATTASSCPSSASASR